MSSRHENPDWYRVVYNLAALRANRASRSGSRARDDDLEAAKRDAELLVREGNRQAGRIRLRFGSTNRGFRRFLVNNVVPSAELLCAGVRLRLGDDDRPEHESPIATVDRVLGNRNVAPRVHYNAACLLSMWLDQADDDRDEVAERAFKQLQHFVWKADPGEAAVIGPWAAKDPTLQPLRNNDTKRFDSIFDPISAGVPSRKDKPAPRRTP